MSAPVVSQYRLLRTRGGVTHFARVRVEVVRASTPPGSKSVADVVATGARPDVPRAWIEAAVRGAREAAARLAPGEAAFVRVVLVEGMVVDTRDDAVECAAALAVWAALRPGETVPEPDFAGNVWRTPWPG